MILNAIGKIDVMTQEILNKSKGQISPILIGGIIKNLINEKVVSHPAIHFSFKDSTTTPYRIDKSDLERAITNILENAISAVSNNNGAIDVQVLDEENYLKICVTDNGIGIEENILATLGKVRVQTTKNDGNGIGLFHTKKIIEEYSGKLQIASSKNEGTKVSVYLPHVAG